MSNPHLLTFEALEGEALARRPYDLVVRDHTHQEHQHPAFPPQVACPRSWVVATRFSNSIHQDKRADAVELTREARENLITAMHCVQKVTANSATKHLLFSPLSKKNAYTGIGLDETTGKYQLLYNIEDQTGSAPGGHISHDLVHLRTVSAADASEYSKLPPLLGQQLASLTSRVSEAPLSRHSPGLIERLDMALVWPLTLTARGRESCSEKRTFQLAAQESENILNPRKVCQCTL